MAWLVAWRLAQLGACTAVVGVVVGVVVGPSVGRREGPLLVESHEGTSEWVPVVVSWGFGAESWVMFLGRKWVEKVCWMQLLTLTADGGKLPRQLRMLAIQP